MGLSCSRDMAAPFGKKEFILSWRFHQYAALISLIFTLLLLKRSIENGGRKKFGKTLIET